MADQPNIVFLLSDQHRPDALGCAGDAVIDTPNIDRLAERGVRFSRAYTTSPLCGPARTSLLSGVYPHNTHVTDNGGHLPDDDASLYGTLRNAGYYTAHVGDADYGTGADVDHLADNEAYMRAKGFDHVHETTGPWATTTTDSYLTDHWAERGLLETFREDYRRRQAEPGYWPSPLPYEDHMDSYIGRRAVEFVEGYDGDDPFCLQVGFAGPHDPMDPPAELAGKYDPDEMPDPLPDVDNPEYVPERAAAFMEEAAVTGPADAWWRPRFTDAEAREWRSYYYAKVTHVDRMVGEVLDALERAGELENTVVVYASDHGETAGDHGTLTKQFFFEPSVGIPLVAAGPGIAEGEETDALVELIDLYPTFLEFAGVDPASGRTFGDSLAPLLADPATAERPNDAAFSLVRAHNGNYKTMVRTDRYKYCVDPWGEGYALFDLEVDPGETTNRLGHPDYGEVERRCQRRLLRFFQTTATQYYRDGGDDVIRPPDLDEASLPDGPAGRGGGN